MKIITEVENYIKSVFSNFKSNDYKGNGYVYALNQIGHFVASTLFILWGIHWFIVAIGWIIWELLQLIKYGDFEDFVKDLIFELGGVILMITPFSYWKIYTGVYAILVLVLATLKSKEK